MKGEGRGQEYWFAQAAPQQFCYKILGNLKWSECMNWQPEVQHRSICLAI